VSLSTGDKKEILQNLGAQPRDLDVLLGYTANAFLRRADYDADVFLKLWTSIFEVAETSGVAYAVNKHLVDSDLQIAFEMPDAVRIELFHSLAGKIPIITTASVGDFENLVQNIVYKGASYPYIKSMGASFVSGKRNRFIILSNKSYSNVSADDMGFDDSFWREKSMTIRKYHECAHYYTKRFFGSAKNNLHDELIADFCGIWAAFSGYHAGYFMQFLAQGRLKIYIENLSTTGAIVVKRLAQFASTWIEEWSNSKEFMQMSETQRIDFLCQKELLDYCNPR